MLRPAAWRPRESRDVQEPSLIRGRRGFCQLVSPEWRVPFACVALGLAGTAMRFDFCKEVVV